MKMFNKFYYILIFFLASCNGCPPGEGTVSRNTNYGYNIIVAFDISNRILSSGRYTDPEILQLVTNNLKTVFQKSIDVGIPAKFYLTTINNNDFKDLNYPDSVFKIDLTRFKTDAVARSNYLYHNDTDKNSLKHDVEVLNSTFNSLYDQVKRKNQLPADIWYFFQDKLTSPVLDTSSNTYERDENYITNKYKNYIIVVTDGYIEAGRYAADKNMRAGNSCRYLSGNLTNEFRDKYNSSRAKDYKEFYKEEGYGITPVKNELLKDCKLLVLELDDRTLVKGVTTKTPPDLEIIRLFWRDWFIKSGVPESNFILKEKLTNKQNLNEVIKNFLELK
jgi:hypothetical protein